MLRVQRRSGCPWLFVVLTGHEPSTLFLSADCPGTFLAACSNFSYAFFELRQDVFLWLFISPTHTPLEKGELLHISPLVLGAEIFMLLVHLSPQTNPCLPASSHPTCQGKGCAVSAGGSKPKFHKGAGMDRVNSFISDSEALANQAIPDSAGKRAVGFLQLQVQRLSSKHDFDEIQQWKSFPSW